MKPTTRPIDATNPAHYREGAERECIDIIRDELGDLGFMAYCLGNARKYLHRAGRKGDAERDLGKADWYVQMGMHAFMADSVPDPRVDPVDWLDVETLAQATVAARMEVACA